MYQYISHSHTVQRCGWLIVITFFLMFTVVAEMTANPYWLATASAAVIV
jgi:hypothetical protein